VTAVRGLQRALRRRAARRRERDLLLTDFFMAMALRVRKGRAFSHNRRARA
jgi:hypothetical protein